jgi:hypothetical protein
VTERLDRIARRFSGMIVDGMCDGSIPPTDPIVAAYVLRSLLNAAYELSVIAPKEETANIVRLCACSYFHGIFAAADDC